ncbi:immunoglobulin superfamily member 10-like [Montipora capricornis]|uniref:immunoglobulin superfamily member 10-like n=1 Tax=Montipora capricornis TaxID=246305 RepID=UPI0035F199A7
MDFHFSSEGQHLRLLAWIWFGLLASSLAEPTHPAAKSVKEERTPPAERKPRISEKDLKNETARPGDDATFVCSAISKGYPTFNFLKWKAPGNVSKVSYTFDLVDFSKSKFLEIREVAKPYKDSRRIYTHRFVIHNVTLADEGKYTCLVGNSAGWVHTHAFLTVDGQAKNITFQLRPMDTTAYVQQNIWLQCKASGDPKPKILWSKDIPGGDRLDSKRFIQHPNGTLQIKEVRLEDQGRYYCIAANHAEMKQVKFNLDVELRRKIKFKLRPKNTTTYVKQNIWLHCKASGVPSPKISWSRDALRGYNLDSKRFIQHPNGTLQIKKVRLEDQGLYYCIAATQFRTKQIEFNLDVQERTPPVEHKPMILEKDLKNETARPGDGATFVCSAISKGHPTFKFLKWKESYTFDFVDFSKSKFLEIREAPKPHKESRRIYTHRFVIHNVTLAEEGKYTCLVGNSAGWVHTHAFLTVDIQAKNITFQLRPMDTTAYVQQNISLHCKASGDPKPKILWGKDIPGGDRLDSKRFIQHPNGTLQIKEVRLEDQGRYYCIAANHAEMKQVKFNLDVEPSKITFQLRPMDTTAYVQQNIWLHCKTSGDPKPKILWSKDIPGGFRLDSKRFIQHLNGTLQIKNLRLEDEGRYFCIATNLFEMKQIKFNLNVQPRNIIFKLQPKDTTAYVQQNIWLHCKASGHPKPKVSWIKDKAGVDRLDAERFIQHANGTLQINDVRMRDQGRFSCVAANQFEMKTAVCGLRVLS